MQVSQGLNRLGIICPQRLLLAAWDGAFCKVGSALPGAAWHWGWWPMPSRPWGGNPHWVAAVGLGGRWGRPGEKERAGCVTAGVFVVLLLEYAAAGNCISLVGLWG